MGRKKGCLCLIIVILGWLIPVISYGAGDGTITIISPKSGEVIQGTTVTIIWEHVKEGRADHVHMIIDGKRQFPVFTVPPKTLPLKPGEHEIIIQAATEDHKLLEPKASVRFKLE